MTLPLSDAIMLGNMQKKADPAIWISPDGSCGCAFGGALLAVGIDPVQFNAEWQFYKQGEWPSVKAVWPWLTSNHLIEISKLYHMVCSGDAVIEDVAAYAKVIEAAAVATGPAEQHEVSATPALTCQWELSRV